MRLATTLLAGGVLLSALAATAQAQTIDGTYDGVYGGAISTQTTQTQFGDANSGVIDSANGSELDVAHGFISGGVLYLFIGGNLETNFNKLELFFDTRTGGQNKLRGDNPNVDFNGLNRLGDDGSGNGLTFDAGFEADYYITLTNGGGPTQVYANWAEVLTGGGGIGNYLGQATPGTGTLSGGTNPDGIQLTINNSNTAGVSGGCGASDGSGVTTGIELAIPMAALGGAAGCVRVAAFVNGGGHDFLANQVLGPLPAGTCNLGEPRAVNFGAFAGDQFFTICPPVPTQKTTWGKVKSIYR
jgi:hypothetical protein